MPTFFLSHAHEDREAAQTLGRALADHGALGWLDVEHLRAGDDLGVELREHVRTADVFVVLLTAASMASDWVKREVAWAKEQRSSHPEYRIVAVVSGLHVSVASWVVGEALVVRVEGPIQGCVGDLLKAIGGIPAGQRAEVLPPPPPLAELVLRFSGPEQRVNDGRTRVHARCSVELTRPGYTPSRAKERAFEAPIGPLELEELRWYVERYPLWAAVEERERARTVEGHLVKWGRALWAAAVRDARQGVEFDALKEERRVVVEVEGDEAGAAALLTLPWELLADDKGFLFAGARPVRVVRRLPQDRVVEPRVADATLRVLLVLARPTKGWIDPRASLGGLVEALRPLGHRVDLKVLAQGTRTALVEALSEAEKAGRPWHVVHFDGHGVYDAQRGLGFLAFEKPGPADAPEVESDLVDARSLGEELRDWRVPLFVLEACQTAQADVKVEASVAAALVGAGVVNVVAMTHSVLVTTAACFTRELYAALAKGERIGTAMVYAQQALRRDTTRSEDGKLRVEDWFVPVLYQEQGGDLALLSRATLPDPAVEERRLAIVRGWTPKEPPHGFVGRGPELLRIARLFVDHRVLGLLARGGEGKTTLAAEVAVWLLDTGRVERLAWVDVEQRPTAEAALDALGAQLVPDWKGVSVHDAAGPGKARQLVEGALRARRCLVVFDNLETALAPDGAWLEEGVRALMAGLPKPTYVLYTSRQKPAPEVAERHVSIDGLGARDARRLVAGVLRRAGASAKGGSAGEEGLDALVSLVGGHARSLVLLAPLVAARGGALTREALVPLVAELERRAPGDRQNSLLASVRLSLTRLSEKHRRQVAALQVFHSAAHAVVLAEVLEVEPEEALDLGGALIGVGLAGAEGSWLIPDPALGAAVVGEGDPEAMAGRWLGAMGRLMVALEQMRHTHAVAVEVAVRVAGGEIVAAVAAFERAVGEGRVEREEAIGVVVSAEGVLAPSRRTSLLTPVVAARMRLAAGLEVGTRARFVAANQEFEWLIDAGKAQEAFLHAERLCVGLRDAEYPGVVYDRAIAAFALGRALKLAGRASEALDASEEARLRFQALADAGSHGAQRAVAVCLADRSDALLMLGKYDAAVDAQERSMRLDQDRGDRHGVAVSRAQIGTIRMMQGRLPEAITAYEAAIVEFEALGHAEHVAVNQHQLGIALSRANDPARGEIALLRALELNTRTGARGAAAGNQGQLATLYSRLDRHEEAATLYHRAAETAVELGDPAMASTLFNNLAASLGASRRLEAARAAAKRAIDLQAPFGVTAESWTTWAILHAIETDAGNPAAAQVARAEALRLYAAYRCSGGDPSDPETRYFAEFTGAIREGADPAELASHVQPDTDFEAFLLPAVHALRAALRGDPKPASDPSLRLDLAVELQLLLEALSSRSPPNNAATE